MIFKDFTWVQLFYSVSLSFTRFLPSYTGLCRVLLGYTDFEGVLKDFT